MVVEEEKGSRRGGEEEEEEEEGVEVGRRRSPVEVDLRCSRSLLKSQQQRRPLLLLRSLLRRCSLRRWCISLPDREGRKLLGIACVGGGGKRRRD